MAKVERLAPFIFKWEGGFVDDALDRGGATNMGVTIATWKQVGYDKNGDGNIDVKDLKKLTKNDVINRVLKPHYWDRWKANQIGNQSVANILVDWVWASGKHGIINPQKMLGVASDGIVGPKTLAVINNYQNQRELFERIHQDRVEFIDRLVERSVIAYENKIGRRATEKELLNNTQKRFQKGWMNRLNDLKYEE